MIDGRSAFKWIYCYLLVAGIFLIIVSRSFLSDGLFMDGMMYATISKNMANGLGTFWHPHFTETSFPYFHQHPPLALGLESIFFRLFGESRYVERFYSVLTILLTGWLIVEIWKSVGKKSSTGWIPLLLWILMPSITWTSVNNMLENTMGIFICLSVLFYIKSLRSNKLIFVLLSGLMLSLGFLTKGFVTFFPLSLPFFMWAFSGKPRFRDMIIDTFLLITSAVLPVILLYIFSGAREFLNDYLSTAFNMIANDVTKESRFFIVYSLFLELIPCILIILVFLFYCMRKKLHLSLLSVSLRPALVFFFLGLAGVLPIMFSQKQSAYYLLTSLAFFAISFSLFICPLAESLPEKISYSPATLRYFRLFVITVFSSGIILTVCMSGGINRDRNMIKDMRVIIGDLHENSLVNILPEMNDYYSLHGYYARFKNISLDPDLKNKHEYLLIMNSMYNDTISIGFEKIDLRTTDYSLFRRRSSGF